MNDRVQELFHELADLPPEERQRYFTERDVDPTTREEVEVLLAFDSGSSSGLLHDIGTAAEVALGQLEIAGMRCGPYRLLHLMGRGGMGAVYRAERVDGEVTQQVAVKLLQPGQDSPQVRQRFLKERQILASLSHPNIARLLDAGHRQNGQPYLAMECVDGLPIDVFSAGLGVRQKVELFLKVCSAVGYLHRNLVVHRDLKPTNILVTADGEPKLLDFGIAKILEPATDHTMTGARMLTPDYASPEQVMGAPISTATDIYSLGAVLYHLLTGKTPHEFNPATPESVDVVICTREITRPSKWAPAVKGDLELVLMKALRKEPSERYATVEQFSEDLEGFLESRPIRARQRDLAYRATKFVRRYWLPLGCVFLAVAGLAAGLAVASRQRNVAERRFAEVRSLANQLLDMDKEVRDLQGGIKAREAIVAVSLGYLERLGREAGSDPDLNAEIAAAYLKVAEVQGIPGGPGHLGKTAAALESLKTGVQYSDRALAERPKDPVLLRTAVRLRMYQVRILEDMKDWAQARLMLDRTRQILCRLPAYSVPAIGQPSVEDRETAGLVQWTAAHLAVNLSHYVEARSEGQLAIDNLRRAAQVKNDPEDWSALGSALGSYADASRYLGDLRTSLQAIRESKEILERQMSAAPNSSGLRLRLAAAYYRESGVLGDLEYPSLGETQQAIASLQRAMELSIGVAEISPKDAISRTYFAMQSLALARLQRADDPAEALAVCDRAMARVEEMPPTQALRNVYRLYLLSQSSYALRALGRQAEATRRIEEAKALLVTLKPSPADGIHANRYAQSVLRAEADNELALGHPQKTIAMYEQDLRDMDTFGARPREALETAAHYSIAYEQLAKAYRQAGNLAAAQSVDAKRQELWSLWERTVPGNPFVAREKAKL